MHARQTSHRDQLKRNGSSRRSSTLVPDDTFVARDPSPQKHKPIRSEGRRQRIVIHTSPFLRCVQTSIAISAGIAQYQGRNSTNGHMSNSKSHHMHSGSPHLHPIDSGHSPFLSAIPEPEEELTLAPSKRDQNFEPSTKTLLRLDAFLGEWLSPDYFDLITPPPSSVLMIASAKAELLRKGEYAGLLHESSSNHFGNFPGGWTAGWGSTTPTTDSDDDGPLTSLTTLGQTLPSRIRANSHSSTGSSGSKGSGRALAKLSTAVTADPTGYVPPTPTYAVSPSGPIPPGYVAHARDACVDVDYQWDSMREPQLWGNGGEYGEEWTSMHKRFRAGFQKMVSWYRTHEVKESPRSASASPVAAQSPADAHDDETDIVIIVVTHGAGCNALIGALTNQPVLLDVGMASLTMAVRKENIDVELGAEPDPDDQSPQQPLLYLRRSSIDLGISERYDMKLVASTDHLRPGFNPLGSPQTQSPRITSPSLSSHKHRFLSTSSSNSPTDTGFSIGEPAASRMLMRNGFSGLPQRSSSTVSPSSPLTGLWSNPSSVQPSKGGGSGSYVRELPADADQKENISAESKDTGTVASSQDNLGGTHSTRGLWGASIPSAQNERDKGPKRRWTVNEQR